MNNYLPKTVIYKNFNDVLSMLKKYNFIFIKASGGTHGKQVISIDRVDRKYKLNFYENGLKEITLEKIEDVKGLVEEFAKGRRFVVQQGVRLLKYNGRIMDLRILMIKDGKGEWQPVQCHSRVARENYTITNFSLGGDWISYDEVYTNLMKSSHDKNIPGKKDLTDATRRILCYIEKELGSFGELGMDIGIDIYGSIWFIEANSRPEKLENESFYNPKELPLSALYIFRYAKFLAKSKC